MGSPRKVMYTAAVLPLMPCQLCPLVAQPWLVQHQLQPRRQADAMDMPTAWQQLLTPCVCRQQLLYLLLLHH